MILNASFITAILFMALSIDAAPAINKRGPVSHSGISAITDPALEGVANPLLAGAGRGVAGAASGDQQAADLAGEAYEALLHTLGGVAANAEQGVGVAAANTAPSTQDTIYKIQANSGIAGDIVRTVGGK